MPSDDRLVLDLLTRLHESAVTVRAEGGDLRLDGAVATLPDETVGLLRAHKAAVLQLLSRVSSRMARPGEPVAIGPLSTAQRAALAAESEPKAARAVLRQSVRTTDEVDEGALRAAFARLLDRHELLRAVVVADGAGPRLVAAAPVPTATPRRGPVDLSEGPVCTLHVHAEENGTRIELAAHPLVADERTLALALDELACLYRGADEVPEPVPYAEFSVAQERYLAHPAVAARRRLIPAAPDALRVPARATARHTAPAPSADVVAVAAELRCTVPILRLGAFLLAVRRRWPGRAVAIQQPNRSGGPFAGVLGPVATTALLTPPAATTVRAFLVAVRDRVLDAHERQDLPADIPAGSLPGLHFTERSGPTRRAAFGGTLLPVEGVPPCGDLTLCHIDGVGLVVDHDDTPEHAATARTVAAVHRFLLDHLDRCLDLAPDELPAGPEEADRLGRVWAGEAAEVDALREILAGVLGRPDVGPRDNFFELGGTSLSVAKVVSRVQRRFGTAPSFADVLAHPSPAALARVLRTTGARDKPALAPLPPLTELPASPQQVRYFLTYDIDPARSGRVTVLTEEWESAEAFRTAVETVVARHESLRTGFFTDASGDLWQRVLPAAAPEIVEVPLDAESDAEQRAELDASMRTHTFDLTAPPLLRVLLHRRPDGGALAAVGVFSGVLDAYSQGTLAAELALAYDAARRGAEPPTPPALQYQDFCRWQHELARGAEFARARAFWAARYPTDHRGFHLPATAGERAGAMRMFLLGEELSARAREAAALSESSLFGFLLANFFARAAELHGRDDVSVGVLYHGRETEELADLVGYFVDLFCLRCDVGRPGDFPDLVRRVNQELFQAVDARVYQYQHLAERLGASPTDAVFPVTGFHVNNVIVPGRTEHVGEGFRERVVDLPYRPKFDFNIYVHETERGILIRMAYATTVVDHERAAAFAADFVTGVRRSADAVLGGAA
ncbi:condensation domain-containing protein [Streptomyces profundus]|uniref:condensation domain-containing protein n=1 Tax=Streptomyces profundus TaxID=2867410 RepID=UPI001D1610E6|nr:condensation domain-containing protein [Streptomyces sp. MA3_2.13]UED87532.1 hypothetical protein K4G22_27795 [Streptomyces sp. MA3_2.13]